MHWHSIDATYTESSSSIAIPMGIGAPSEISVVVVSFEVVLGEQAVGQPVLSSFHTPEQARLFRTEPAVEGSLNPSIVQSGPR